jgi:hypothetical protein
MEMSDQSHAPVAIPPSIHLDKGKVGLRAWLNAVEKKKIPCNCLESNPDYSVVQSVA